MVIRLGSTDMEGVCTTSDVTGDSTAVGCLDIR